MIDIGCYHLLKIDSFSPSGAYLDAKDGDVVLLPKKYLPAGCEIGQSIRVFVLTDSEDRPVATTQNPIAVRDEFAVLKVKELTEFGAFLDWGLDKDLFVPFREQAVRMIPQQFYVVRICFDPVSGRLMGTSRIRRFLRRSPQGYRIGQPVDIVAFAKSDLGISCIVDGEFEGLLHHSIIGEMPQIGESQIGYVQQVREDGKIDLLLNPPGYESVRQAMPIILEALKQSDGFLPFTGKSDSEDIIQSFKMSKKLFKKAVGGLYKDRKILIKENGLYLVSEDQDSLESENH